MGGAVGEVHGAKLTGLLERALDERPAAVLLLVESGGVRLHEANAGLIAVSEVMRAVLAVRAAGIPDLENMPLAMHGPHGDFYLVGIGDYHSGQSHPPRAFRRIPKDARALCFTHSPDSLPILPRNCALTLAGHTHGGQIWLPLLGRPAVSFASMYGQRYAIGTVREDGKTMFVSPGIGTSLFPARFGVPPEISFLTIR